MTRLGQQRARVAVVPTTERAPLRTLRVAAERLEAASTEPKFRCWKTYVGQPEADWPRRMAINVLGNGLHETGSHEDTLSVKEAELAMEQRLGDSEESMLGTQSNLAITYENLGRLDEALRLKRDVYSGCLKLNGEENDRTLLAANNYASSLAELKRFEEAKTLLRKTMPVARRVVGGSHELALSMSALSTKALYTDEGATLDDVREAVTTLEDTARTARRVLGDTHPLTVGIEYEVPDARAALAAREGTPPPGNARP